MGRNQGSFIFTNNFEVQRAQPLDARQRVDSYTDLINPSVWVSTDGYVWLYNGAIVVVSNDPSSGVYWLKDAANYTNYDNWIAVGGGTTPLDPSALQEVYSYIDGSLAQRDSSISALDTSIKDIYVQLDVIDSSISYLVNWNEIQDASILALDSSLSDLWTRTVVNIGDPSAAEIFAGYDSSNNIQLRGILGSGAAQVTQTAENIVIGLDASFAGEVNYGQNVGSGDASIYYQKLGDALQFREIEAGPNVTVDVSDNLIVIGASGGTGDGVDGGVWITDIDPQSTGNVGDKVFSSDGNVLDSCLTDTNTIIVDVLALPGHTNYKPIVTIEGSPVSLSEDPDKPLWVGSYPMTFNFSDSSITVHHEDGASWSTTVDADTPAVIQSAEFTGGYPGSQTELKAGDTFDVSIVTDVSIVSVIVDNFGAFTGGTYPVTEGNNVGFTATIANRGTSVQSLGMRVRVVKSTGSTSDWYLSSSQGSVDGKDLVDLNNLYPGIVFGTITYPAPQQAIKLGETATVANTVTNYDTMSYTSPNGELGIASPSVFANPKTVSYSSGGYNISTNNLRITANRAANDATSTSNTVVWIANTPATLTVSNPAARLRSGGNDGTSAQNHTITINANGQRLLSAPTLVKDTGGTWLGGGFSWSASATSFTRTLQVDDNMSKGTYNWGAISGTNLANITTTTNSGATQYILGGFVQRTLTIAAFGWQTNMNVEVSDYSKLSSTGSGSNLAWTVKDLPTRSTIGDTTRPQADVWSASATFTNPTTINILDKSATDSASAASTFTIQEGI